VGEIEEKTGNKNPDTTITKIRNKNYSNPGTKFKKIWEQIS
jgi:hypothetical protein